jgi:hypothetical protein
VSMLLLLIQLSIAAAFINSSNGMSADAVRQICLLQL